MYWPLLSTIFCHIFSSFTFPRSENCLSFSAKNCHLTACSQTKYFQLINFEWSGTDGNLKVQYQENTEGAVKHPSLASIIFAEFVEMRAT